MYFNMNGQREYRTCLGACCTLLILTFLGLVTAMLSRSVYGQDHNRPLSVIRHPNYFGSEIPLKQQQGWKIAVGLSSISDFQTGQTASDLVNYAKFTANYEVNGGPDNGIVFPLTLQVCTDQDWNEFYALRAS